MLLSHRGLEALTSLSLALLRDCASEGACDYQALREALEELAQLCDRIWKLEKAVYAKALKVVKKGLKEGFTVEHAFEVREFLVMWGQVRGAFRAGWTYGRSQRLLTRPESMFVGLKE